MFQMRLEREIFKDFTFSGFASAYEYTDLPGLLMVLCLDKPVLS